MSCQDCNDRIRKLRRCRDDRFDFTEADGASIWPMYINAGGETYGFCPAKATWDQAAIESYRLLLIAAETGAMLVEGGIADQPVDFIDNLSWFLIAYRNIIFASRLRAVLGTGIMGAGKSARIK